MNDIVKNILRIGIGSVFIIAAILKLISIDEFEIYIYSFNIFSFFVTTILSRLLITGEFVLGLFLIFKIYYRFTWRAILTIQILFTIFLVYVVIFRDDSNCHCFGELIELSPTQSILKNILFIGALFLLKPRSTKPEKLKSFNSQILRFSDSQILKTVPIISLILVFIISPTDSIYKMIYSTEKEISTIDLEESFDEVSRIGDGNGDGNGSENGNGDGDGSGNGDGNESENGDGSEDFNIGEGRRMLVIVSSGCKYCKLGVKKLSMIMKREGYDIGDVDIFIWGSPEGISDFREETMTEDYRYWHILPNKAIDITYGRFPIFIWFDKKEIVKIGDFRDLDDDILWSI